MTDLRKAALKTDADFADENLDVDQIKTKLSDAKINYDRTEGEHPDAQTQLNNSATHQGRHAVIINGCKRYNKPKRDTKSNTQGKI